MFLKIWRKDRDPKFHKAVIVADLEELRQKGKQKLELDSVDKIVLEVDGTEVDDDDILAECSSSVLILLQMGENWEPVEPPSAMNLPVASGHSLHPDGFNQSMSSETLFSSPAESVSMENDDPETDFSEKQSGKVRVLPHPERIELPNISPALKIALMNNSSVYFNQVVNETAVYYSFRYPEMKSSEYYQSIGRRMIRQYPVLSHEGSRPWSFFIGKVGQRIRHLRMKENSKSRGEDDNETGPREGSASSSPKTKKFRVEISNPMNTVSDEQYETYLVELSNHWKGNKHNRGHILTLLKETRAGRRKWTTSLPAGAMRCIAEKFPCFEEGAFVLEEFFNLLSVEQDTEKMRQTVKENMESFWRNVKRTIKFEADDATEVTAFNLVQAFENHVGVNRGKGKKSKSVIRKLEVEDLSKIDSLLQSDGNDPPHLIIFTRNNTFELAYVVGDAMNINCQTSSIMDSVVLLLATYYVFDLDYPDIYSQALGIMQQFVLKQPFTGKKSKSMLFVKEYMKNC